jgi:hypothetical protein
MTFGPREVVGSTPVDQALDGQLQDRPRSAWKPPVITRLTVDQTLNGGGSKVDVSASSGTPM